MTPQEHELVKELFDRLAQLESNPRDPSAERLIADGLRDAPHAVYALVQTALVQDEALKRANARIEELQAQIGGEERQRSGGFLDSVRDAVLGRSEPRGSVPSVHSQSQSSPTTAPPYRPQPGYSPQTPPYPPGPGLAPGMGPAFGSGGSFLGTAASTAAGVIGGGSCSTASVRCSVITPALADTSEARSGVPAAGPPIAIWRSRIGTRTRIKTRTTTTKRRRTRIKIGIKIKIKIKTTTPVISAGTIPMTPDLEGLLKKTDQTL